MLSLKLSNKLKIASFLATIMVVYRHSFTTVAFFENHESIAIYNKIIHRLIASTTEIAVPYFFLVSGFFFFQINYSAEKQYSSMLKKKFFSLLIPYLLWNFCGLIIIFFYSPELIPTNSIWDLFKHFIMSKYYAPLWYVRDLLLLMILVPLYQWIYNPQLKYIPVGVILCVLLYLWTPVTTTLLNVESILFFFAGGLLSKKPDLLNISFRGQYLIILFFIWIIPCTFINLWNYEILHKATTILGIIAFWSVIDFLNKQGQEYLLSISQYAFFIYVTHFYTIKTIKILLSKIFPENNIAALLTFLFLPYLIIIILVKIGKILAKYTPLLYYISMGRRTFK